MNLSGLLAASTLALAVRPCAAQVTTSQYNNSRTATTVHEKILTPQNVNAQQFGKLGAFKVDGAVYAQPLYVPGVPIRASTCASVAGPVAGGQRVAGEWSA